MVHENSIYGVVWKNLIREKRLALLEIGSRKDGYHHGKSDHDFLALVPGSVATGICISAASEDMPVECMLLGVELVDSFLRQPRTDFVDSSWLSALCLLSEGMILFDPFHQAARLKGKVQEFLSSDSFSNYLLALLYRGEKCVMKSAHFLSQGDLAGARLTQCYAIWELATALLAAKGTFFRGPSHFVSVVKYQEKDVYKRVEDVCFELSVEKSHRVLETMLLLTQEYIRKYHENQKDKTISDSTQH